MLKLEEVWLALCEWVSVPQPWHVKCFDLADSSAAPLGAGDSRRVLAAPKHPLAQGWTETHVKGQSPAFPHPFTPCLSNLYPQDSLFSLPNLLGHHNPHCVGTSGMPDSRTRASHSCPHSSFRAAAIHLYLTSRPMNWTMQRIEITRRTET